MDYNDRLPGNRSPSLPTLRTSVRGGRKDHAGGAGRRVSGVISRPARKLARAAGISHVGHQWRGRMQRLVRAITDNSLTIILFVLFVVCISGDSFAGWRLQNETLATHGQASIGFGQFLLTGVFLEGLASNWQAAVLQLGSLILFSSFLFQRGAPHSLNPHKAKHEEGWRKAGHFTWFYRHSLVLAFLLLFLLSIALHVVFGDKAYNEARALAGQPPFSIGAFILSAQFWAITLQTWQAEYLAIALYIVLTIFLRQQDSPESKPVESSNKATGEANK